MRIGIVGAGIVGLTLARHLVLSRPHCTVTVLEKESSAGQHQTSHNSGVVHAGLYYQPGSLKAQLCGRGRGILQEYCQERGIPFRESGKLVVAVTKDEVPGLREIERRSRLNNVPGLKWLEPDAMRDVEPHVVGAAALHSPHTAIVDFPAVAQAVAADVVAGGGLIRFNQKVCGIRRKGGSVEVLVGKQIFAFDRLVICAGLQADRIAELTGASADPRIVPFLGMYYELSRQSRDLVRSLIYPVPDPRYPFLGVHLTRTPRDEVVVGPNAVLGLARERYRPVALELRDVWSTLSWPGFYRLARRHWRAGARELYGAIVKRSFVEAARRYIPELTAGDFHRGGMGVRAQAVAADGGLIDDFALDVGEGIVAVRNAPSPAATSSFAIAEYLAARI